MADKFTIMLLLPSYKELNRVYEKIAGNANMSYADQMQITRFYNRFYDEQCFEQIIIELLLSSDSIAYSLLTTSLKMEIEKCRRYFKTNQALLTGIDTVKICRDAANFYDEAIKEQEIRTREYSDALKDIYGSLNMLGYRNAAEGEEQALRRKEEHLTPLYKEEQKKLSRLYDMRRESWEETAKYSPNLFLNIDKLNTAFLRILWDYSPENNNSSVIKPPGEKYFDMGVISTIYKQVNGAQFEEVPEMDFYAFMNLMHTNATLVIKPGEKTRVCYLIHKLYEYIGNSSRSFWRSSILQKLGIEEGLYFAKYKEPVSEFPSRKSESFAKQLHELL